MNDLVLPGVVVHRGNVVDVLRQLPAESVHTVVTSPPYWGLRAYKSEPQVWGGDPAHEHDWREVAVRGSSGGTDNAYAAKLHTKGSENYKAFDATRSELCDCGAWRGELGLEPTPELFVAHIVDVFREVRRVLRGDGTAWVNFGDGYVAGGGPSKQHLAEFGERIGTGGGTKHGRAPLVDGLKPKDMVGMPWRVAFALQADGWWLRSDIIWSKPNPMPESIRDRPTKSHEYLFLLAKSERYFYDMDAIRERTGTEVTWEQWEIAEGRHAPAGPDIEGGVNATFGSKKESFTHPAGRNKRTVWTIPTQPYPEAHFATFPEDLVEPCVKAGSSQEGVCSVCGAPWRRVTKVHYIPLQATNNAAEKIVRDNVGKNEQSGLRRRDGFNERWDAKEREYEGRRSGDMTAGKLRPQEMPYGRAERVDETIGWEPTCAHADAPKVPATVLEPFAGSGTTLAVAKKLGRRAVGVELQPSYLPLIRRRLERAALPLFDELDFEAPRQEILLTAVGPGATLGDAESNREGTERVLEL